MKKIIDLFKGLSDRWYLEAKEDWAFSLPALINISVGYIFITKGSLEIDINIVYAIMGIIFDVSKFGKLMFFTGLILMVLTISKPKTLHKYILSLFSTLCSACSFFLYAIISQSVGTNLATPVLLLIISFMSLALFFLEGVRLCQHLIQKKTKV